MIVTDESFDRVLDSHKLVLIDFWAEWCGPCKKISPILDEISNERGLWVGKLNVDLAYPGEVTVTIPEFIFPLISKLPLK